jgi:hypothetical protein
MIRRKIVLRVVLSLAFLTVKLVPSKVSGFAMVNMVPAVADRFMAQKATGSTCVRLSHAHQSTWDNGLGSDGVFCQDTVNGGASHQAYVDDFLQAIPKPTTMIMLGIAGLLTPRRWFRRYARAYAKARRAWFNLSRHQIAVCSRPPSSTEDCGPWGK